MSACDWQGMTCLTRQTLKRRLVEASDLCHRSALTAKAHDLAVQRYHAAIRALMAHHCEPPPFDPVAAEDEIVRAHNDCVEAAAKYGTDPRGLASLTTATQAFRRVLGRVLDAVAAL